MNHWFLNGKPVAAVPVDDRAVQYGDGLFETIAVRKGTPRLFEMHMERLARGCAMLRIEMPIVAGLRRDLAAAIEQSHEMSAYSVAKIIVSSGVSKRGYGRIPPTPATVIIGVFPARPVETSAYRDGVDTVLCESRLAIHSPTAGLKTLNRIEQVLGRSECLAAGAFEGLMLDAERRLICGTMSNVFIVTNQRIATPSLKRCGVAGVMRQLGIQSLRDEGIEVDVRDVTVDEFHASDEVFLTNSQFGALPVSTCGKHAWKAREMTNQVMATLARNGIAEYAA